MSKEKKNIDLREFKKEFFSEYWVEERHYKLNALPTEKAKEILESFDDSEACENVNYRRHQEDYISDYLAEVWGISKKAFWQHIKVSWQHPEGTVVGDHNFHVDMMKSQFIPDDVWAEILNSIASEDSWWNIMTFWYDIIINQTATLKSKGRRQKQLIEWFNGLNEQDKKLASERLIRIFSNKPPNWLKPLL